MYLGAVKLRRVYDECSDIVSDESRIDTCQYLQYSVPATQQTQVHVKKTIGAMAACGRLSCDTVPLLRDKYMVLRGKFAVKSFFVL